MVLISLDTLRADRLSCYGNPHRTSPAADRLAEEGVLFERALSTSSWTLPAHVSMLTGLPVSAHGVCHGNPATIADSLRGEFVSERLGRAGYATAGFYTCLWLEPRFGFGGGFDTWEHASRSTERARELRRRWEEASGIGDEEEIRRIQAESGELTVGMPEAEECVDRALAWLDGQVRGEPERPFFLFLHLFDIHDPYRPPEPWDRAFDPDYRGDIRVGTIQGSDPTFRPGMDPRDFEHVLALYDGEIGWVDSQVGRVLDRLERLGAAGDTLVVLTSDHGEELLDHGGRGHHRNLYRESVHVPLILRFPRVLPAGVRVSSPVSIIDIVPTLHALAGVPAPAGLPGRDLTPLLGRGAEDPGRVLLSELVMPGQDPPRWQVSLYRADEHLIVHQAGTASARAERFDLSADPMERGASEPVSWESERGRALALELDRVRARVRALRAGLAQRGGAAASLSEQEMAQLEALGYTGLEAEPEAGDQTRLCLDGCGWREE